MALYNEIDPFAADWLEKLIEAGHVAPGRVERRSIRDLAPKDLEGVTQAHFFAGIGGWSHALRLAGWPDDLSVWTGSCPCQPFSVAGKRKGITDDRHLWPVWFGLIRECRPAIVFGEQVASPDGLDWLDAVSADLEGAGYAFAAADLCAASVGAPHARQRLYFVAHAHGLEGRIQLRGGRSRPEASQSRRDWPQERVSRPDGPTLGVADAEVLGRGGRVSRSSGRPSLEPHGRRPTRLVGDANGRAAGRHTEAAAAAAQGTGQGARGESRSLSDGALASSPARAPSGTFPGAVRGFWSDAEWIACTDGKWRPTGPGLFPLAHGVPNRLGTLRGAGNAIVPQNAACFVSAVMDVLEALS